jgi:Spy/CpxP family protein refolding chaperone
MKRFIAVALLLTAFVAAGTYSIAIADDAAGKPKPEKKDKAPKAPKLTKPWSELSDLSDDQKSRISDIHKKAVDEMKAIQERERQDIMAVLTEEQKAKISQLEQEEAAKKKEAAAAKKKEMSGGGDGGEKKKDGE